MHRNLCLGLCLGVHLDLCPRPDAKIRMYADHTNHTKCNENRLGFTPMVMEVYGGFGSRALPILRRLGRGLAAVSKDHDVDRATNQLASRLSFACQRALARGLVARYGMLSPLPPLPHGGD